MLVLFFFLLSKRLSLVLFFFYFFYLLQGLSRQVVKITPILQLLDIKDSKEAVYGALDAWVAWEQNFPIASLKRALLVLEKEQQWHRIIQVWAILSLSLSLSLSLCIYVHACENEAYAIMPFFNLKNEEEKKISSRIK